MNKIPEQIKEIFAKLSTQKKVLLVAAVLGLLGLLGFGVQREASTPYAVLFSGLEAQDAAAAIERLKAENVPYRLSQGGATVEVPEGRALELRLLLAAAGIPRGGNIGFEIFDQQTFGATSFVEQMNFRRALSGELARTIGAIEAVERARVHLAMKERSLFKSEDQLPSASIAVELRHGRNLSPGQVKGIVHLVSSSVEGLLPEHVTLVDGAGNVLWSGGDSGEGNQLERDLERTLSRRILDITDRIVGQNRAVVAVTAVLDRAQSERTEEIYDPAKVAVRSESRSDEQTPVGSGNGGLSGVRGNLVDAMVGPPAPEVPSAPLTASKSSETRNFEVNRVTSRIVGPKVKVQRLHVAVLIDQSGIKTSSVARLGGADGEREVLALISRLAKEAAGLDLERGDRIEVVATPFAIASDALEPAKHSATQTRPISERQMMLLGTGAVGLLLISTLALLLRKRRKLSDTPAEPTLPALPVTVEVMASAIEGGGSGPFKKPEALNVRDRALLAARGDTLKAAKVLTAWLHEPAPAAKGATK